MKQQVASVLIDVENISVSYALSLLRALRDDLSTRQASIEALFLVGNALAQHPWQQALAAYPVRCIEHAGGKEAADHCLEQEALRQVKCDINLFYLVSDDNDFVGLVNILHSFGCQVIHVGHIATAKRLKSICDDSYLLLKGDSYRHTTQLDSANQSSHQEVCHENEVSETNVLPKYREPALPFTTVALPTISDSHQPISSSLEGITLPESYSQLLRLFTVQTLHTLCLTEQESERLTSESPDRYANLFQTLMSDTLLGSLLAEGDLHQEWQHILNLARRCEYFYMRGQEEATRIFTSYPRPIPLELAHVHLISQLQHFRPHFSFLDVSEPYQDSFRNCARLDTELPILCRWYRRGYLSQC